MSFFEAFLGEVFSIIGFLLIAAGVYKVFQMSTDLHDMKDLLREIKHNTQDYTHQAAGVQAAEPPVVPDAILARDA